MFAPPLAAAAAASSDIHSPCLSAFEQPTGKALVSESTLSQLVFPNEFRYEFDFSAFTSTEDETNDDEDDFLAGLTRRLSLFTQRLVSPPPPFVTDKAKVNSTESTRSGPGSCTTSCNKSPNGPFSQTPSPPETPYHEDYSLKVVSAAAGEVAKPKVVANFDAKPNRRRSPKPISFAPSPQNAAFYNYHCYYCWWLWQPQPALTAYPYPVRGVFAAPTAVKQPSTGTGVFTTPTAVKQPSVSTGVFTAPTAVKQPSAGTGVFLPRNYSNPSGSLKKAGGGSVKLPKKVVQTEHTKTEKLSGRCQSRTKAHLSAGGSKLDTKSTVSAGCLKEERHLPQDWMY